MDRALALCLALVLVAVPLVGCLGTADPVTDTPEPPEEETENEPVLLPETLSALEEVGTLALEGSGTGIWIDEARDLVYSANGGAGLAIVDVQDPSRPERVGLVDDIYARDADMLEWQGRNLVLLAGGGDGLHVVDASDPYEPELLATAQGSVHNLAAVPGTPYVYVSTGVGVREKVENPHVPILDLTEPEDPTWTSTPIPAQVNGVPVQSDGCHDVTVRVDLGRAYCAGGGGWYAQGGGETFIWDIEDDLLQPEWIGIIDNPSIVYHHQALASEDGSLLMINDEFIAPNCHAAHPVEAAPGVKQSTAAMWVYDISDPATPELRSHVQPNVEADQVNCGSHFGDLVDGRDAVVWGWYEGGTLLIDISDPSEPTILDRRPPEGSTWDARYHAGYVYGSSGDLQVFKVV